MERKLNLTDFNSLMTMGNNEKETPIINKKIQPSHRYLRLVQGEVCVHPSQQQAKRKYNVIRMTMRIEDSEYYRRDPDAPDECFASLLETQGGIPEVFCAEIEDDCILERAIKRELHRPL
jgi:hypothetical protein